MSDSTKVAQQIALAIRLATEAAEIIARLRSVEGMTDEQLTEHAGDTAKANMLTLLEDLAKDKAEAERSGGA